ncbi:MAG: Ryanodine receptor Ryr [Clostridia bacterium]|nr:Ryanodine receptor Ryr [Clostridia bacterium]
MYNAENYKPCPTDTSDVVVPEEIMQLVEDIAKEVHDTWAITRIEEGWTYGEEKDGAKKTTPLLVPYEELPESEKEYDRNTALSTIKLILKYGYEISKEE